MNLTSCNLYNKSFKDLSVGKLIINTLNAYSYNLAQKDPLFEKALTNSDILLPDGISIVMAAKWIKGETLYKIAGIDLFFFEMERLQASGGKGFFLGSTRDVLTKIQERSLKEYPGARIKTFSPPFTPEFSEEENTLIVNQINEFHPDVLFIGMTAPKQEKWAFQQFSKLQVGHVCCIGAVFDFYAGTIKRAPKWMICLGLEWLYRLIKEPRRMWRRYLIGNVKFLWLILNEKFLAYKRLYRDQHPMRQV